MPAKAGIQSLKKLNKIINWIAASAGMTAFSLHATQSLAEEGSGEGKRAFSEGQEPASILRDSTDTLRRVVF
jgi:hypothetical protein